jgi:catechol 2,3-dioxygenase-like lactoylglutathione lyase family enzyme
MDVRFIAGFGPVAPDLGASRAFYIDALGLPLTGDASQLLDGDASYLHTTAVEGAKHFAVWPLAGAAQSCFGTETWPREVPVPQGWIEFDVDDVRAATAELTAHGYQVLVANTTEPWGQTVSRLLGSEGLLVGVAHTPDV